ncbi:hypothetical protein AAZX31_08G348900 [Glycine max]|nr:embryo-specific protein ATS3A [Glycine max]KAH1054717.1 hypothetical protein GYH30_023479 [Glycine max]KRH46826.2 hypothetical protein GLYMA_08G359000v4 [Glycine max]|eukprot:XP_003530892.3 embryo-specific protein ATS3A [Glycine max]
MGMLIMKSIGGHLICCCVLLQVLVAGGESLEAPELKKNCTYVITIETTCTWGAETSNIVSLRFGDTNSNVILVRHLNSKHLRKVDPLEPEVLDDMPRKPFTAPCVNSPICYLYLKLIGNDDWRPGFAQIQVLEGSHLNSDYFYFRRFVPRHVWHGSDVCDSEVTPFGLKKKRNVYVNNIP